MIVGEVILYTEDDKIYGKIKAVINPMKFGIYRHATYFEPEEFPDMTYDEVHCEFNGNVNMKDVISIEIEWLDTIKYVGEICEIKTCLDIIKLEYIKEDGITILIGR